MYFGILTGKPDVPWVLCVRRMSNSMYLEAPGTLGFADLSLRVRWDLPDLKNLLSVWHWGGRSIRGTLCIHFCLKILGELNVSGAARYIGMAT